LARRIGVIVLASVVVVVLVVVAFANGVRPPHVLPGTPLGLRTEPNPSITLGCPAAAVVPSRLAVRDGALVLVPVGTTTVIEVVWPHGYEARLVEGRGALFDDWGSEIAAEGDVFDGTLGGGTGGGTGIDDLFHVCSVGPARPSAGASSGSWSRPVAARHVP
jgi:hypothetical protein